MTSLTPPPSPTPHAPAASPTASAPSGRATPPIADRIAACYDVLETLRLGNGLYLASPSADYSKVWLRDTFYESLPYVDKPTHHYEQTYWSLLDILRRHEWKIDAIVRQKPLEADAYIHARFHPETLREFHEPWGNKQNDATGALLFGVALGLKHGRRVLRDERDRRVVQKLVRMLGALRYWEDPDNGMWEEAEEVHASSVGACVGGLAALRDAGFDVPDDLIREGRRALDALLPRESATKRTDLALLSLCYPYRVVTPAQRRAIVEDVERHLLRARGVIRYEGDSYYSTLAEEHGRDKPWEFYHGTEAEWCFGLPWLSLIHRDMGNKAKADQYLAWTARVLKGPGCLPELYFAGSDEVGPNTPLGWSVAMHILALEASQKAGQ
ncbi:MAG TPA: glycoside hydrolase family 15 protein [Candidatus Thermoplasmatota archaeon]|nr:glycoside hydrolase family 15 protein [Candidatus Thermoplasmatota archaeon]